MPAERPRSAAACWSSTEGRQHNDLFLPMWSHSCRGSHTYLSPYPNRKERVAPPPSGIASNKAPLWCVGACQWAPGVQEPNITAMVLIGKHSLVIWQISVALLDTDLISAGSSLSTGNLSGRNKIISGPNVSRPLVALHLRIIGFHSVSRLPGPLSRSLIPDALSTFMIFKLSVNSSILNYFLLLLLTILLL